MPTTKTAESTAKRTGKKPGAKRTSKSAKSATKRKPGQLPTQEASDQPQKPRREAADKDQILADKLLSLMAAGTLPWRQHWWTQPCANLLTGHRYQGWNPLFAQVDAEERGFEHLLFVGFRQAASMGWKVAGKATWLRSMKVVAVKDENGEETGDFRRWFDWVPVFNVAVLDDSGAEVKVSDYIAKFATPENLAPRIDAAEDFIAAQNPVVIYGGSNSSYDPTTDIIRMPRFKDFTDAEAYYAVHIHELIHRTGHPTRLNRPIFSRFGTNAYAFEELVAELGAVFICAQLGLSLKMENHASYLNHWQAIIASDNRAFLKAMTLARKSADHLLANAGMLIREAEEAEVDTLPVAA